MSLAGKLWVGLPNWCIRTLYQSQNLFFCCSESQNNAIVLKCIEKKMLKILQICGIEGIKRVFMHRNCRKVWDNENRSKPGSCVLGMDHVDSTRTISNDIVELSKILGIESARTLFVSELRNVIPFYGSFINYRHLACLADTMTL